MFSACPVVCPVSTETPPPRQLYRALILLSLALFRAPLCLRSSWCYICINIFLLTSFSLHFSELSLVRLAVDLVD